MHALASLAAALLVAGCATFSSPPDPEVGDKPGSFRHLEALKRQGKPPEFFQRAAEIRRHAAWLREQGRPGAAAAVEARLAEIMAE